MKRLFFLLLFIPLFSQGAVDHSHQPFTQLLEKFTSVKAGQTYVWYGKWKKDGSSELEAYLKSLSEVKKAEFGKFTSDQKLVFLINSYNAFTIKLILDHYPLKSIKETGNLITGPWKKKFFTLLGEKSHLDHIEHELIRKNFNEPRIHFAVNCASIGCPSLMRKAFTAAGMEQELTLAEKEFFKNPSKFKVGSGEFQVSRILEWYGDDFRKKHSSLEKYLVERASAYKLLPSPLAPAQVKISYLEYDWSLNGE